MQYNLVSVCIPVYNRESLESNVDRTYRSIEIIISDNRITADIKPENWIKL